MNRIVFFAPFFILIAAVSACGQKNSPPESIWESIPLSSRAEISLEIDSGEVVLTGGGQPGIVQVEGNLLDPQRVGFSVSSTQEKVVISGLEKKRPTLGFSSSPIFLSVKIPNDIRVRVNTFDATVIVRDYQGDLLINSVSGNLLAERVNGTISMVSGRGDVTIRQSSGELRILGEHGILTLQEISGKIGSSTIMGTIRYIGRPTTGDDIHLEVDHGPVEISLAPDTNLEVDLTSNSGDVSCVAQGVQDLGRNCKGTLGLGGATLSVRTVSGRISLRLSPLIP